MKKKLQKQKKEFNCILKIAATSANPSIFQNEKKTNKEAKTEEVLLLK